MYNGPAHSTRFAWLLLLVAAVVAAAAAVTGGLLLSSIALPVNATSSRGNRLFDQYNDQKNAACGGAQQGQQTEKGISA